jgi:glycosyltransferase involved in cell wall biosynthesis
MRIRVAHVCTIDQSLRYLLLDQMRYLQGLGYDVVGVSTAGPDVPYLEERGLRHHAVTMTRRITPLADARALWELVSLFRRERITIVHGHNPKPGLLAQTAARLAGVPVIVKTIHGFYFHDRMRPAPRRFYVAMEKLGAMQSHGVLSQNPEDVVTAEREGICAPGEIELLGNGIDLERFDPARLDPAAQAALRAKLGLGEGPVVGFVGRLVAEKGLLELFAAFAEARKRFPSARLLVVGPLDTEKADALSPASAADFGIADACVFTGMRADIPELLGLCDVFVLPSHREGFPRSAMEAAAMERPVLTTDERGCRQTVLPGRTGLLVPVADAPALARGLLELLEQPARSRAMGKAGRELAKERFDQRRVFDIVARMYARLLRERGLPVPHEPSYTPRS